MSLLRRAEEFAERCHKGQKRKYTGIPYISHPRAVAQLIKMHMNARGQNDLMIRAQCVALLHDVMEDCGVTFDELHERFGYVIADGVRWLSDLEEGNRDQRKALSRKRLAEAPAWIQDIKVCDLIHNTESIVAHDPVFAKKYLAEKKLLLDHSLTKAHPTLLRIARKQIEKTN